MLLTSGRAVARALTASLTRPAHQLSNNVSRVYISSLSHRARRGQLAPVTPLTFTRRSYASEGTKPKPKGTARKTTVTKKRKAASPKKKVSPRKKKAAAKPKKKKVLTAEQKARATAAKEAKAEVEKRRRLKAAALTIPKKLPSTAFTVLVAELAKAAGALRGAEASSRYRNFSPSELEQYNHIANQNRAANEAAYKKWVESHSSVTIKNANNARRLIWRRAGSPKDKRPRIIKDDRISKQPLSGFVRFTVERHNSGDLANMRLGDASQLISREWKALAETDRKRYLNAAANDRATRV